MAAIEKSDIRVNSVISSNELKAQAETEVTLPDYLPDITRVVKADAIVSLGSVNCDNEEVTAVGEVVFTIIYAPENSLSLRSIKARAPFENSMELKGADEDCRVITNEKISFVNCKTVSARRISLIAGVQIDMLIESDKTINAASGSDSESGIESKIINKTCCVFSGSGEKQFKIEEDIEIPDSKPAAATVIFQSVTPVMLDLKKLNDRVAIRGEARVNTLFVSDMETGEIDMISATLPFNQIVDVPGMNDESVLKTRMKLRYNDNALYENKDGENRIISVSADIVVSVAAYSCADIDLIEDAYSPTNSCEIKYAKEQLEQLCGELRGEAIIKAPVNFIDPIESIIYSSGAPNVISSEIRGRVLVVSGELAVSIVFRKRSGEIDNLDQIMPFSSEIPVNCEFEKYTSFASVQLEGLSCLTLSDSSAEVRATVAVNAEVQFSEQIEFIEDIALDPENSQKYNPYLVLYYPVKSEPLWDIAKKYNSTMSKIKSANNLNADTADGKMIVIPRSRT